MIIDCASAPTVINLTKVEQVNIYKGPVSSGVSFSMGADKGVLEGTVVIECETSLDSTKKVIINWGK